MTAPSRTGRSTPGASRPVHVGPAGVVGGWVVRLGPVSIRIDPRAVLVAVILLAIVVVLGLLTLTRGTPTLSVHDMVAAIFGDGEDRVIRSVRGRRLPRLITALLVGGSLGVSGSVFQSLSRNALGSPDIIGFTTGAAAGAVIQIVLFDGGVWAVAGSAIAGGVVTALVVYGLARKDGVSGGMRLVLVGIGVSAILTALISFFTVFSALEEAEEIQRWEAGSLIGRGWPHALSVLAAVVILVPALMACRRAITYLEMGDDSASAVGIPAEAIRFGTLVIAVALLGVAVAATGPIAFIALAAPQVAARLTGRGGVQIVPSFLLGATFLGVADFIHQNVDFGLRAPVGLITAVIGGCYLIYLLARRA
jgi:iron complex transport system permease protein